MIVSPYQVYLIIEKKDQPIYSKPYIELDHVYIIYVEYYKIWFNIIRSIQQLSIQHSLQWILN